MIGYKDFQGLLDDRCINECQKTVAAIAALIARAQKDPMFAPLILFTGCGTSGRVAHLAARRLNKLFPDETFFGYCIAGGDSCTLLLQHHG